MEITAFLESLKADERFSPYITHIEKIDERPSSCVTGADLPDVIKKYLELKKISLFTHQYKAFCEVMQGTCVILCTATASGKTLAFSLPLVALRSENPKATALAIYPTKALSHDQKKTFEALGDETGINLAPAVYDGDTPRNERPGIRRDAGLILTNPHEIHHLLPWHHQWRRFFEGLSLIIIDEAHQYRGVYGSHMAYLIRRIRRICNHYGSNPVFVLASATLANPDEFARELTGHSCTVIDTDGSPHKDQYFALYNPYTRNGVPRSYFSESAALTAASVEAGFQTLCFTSSRKMTELISTWAQEQYQKKNETLYTPIKSYRAGYLPRERRQIEDDLKQGRIRGIISTNALELGIDIGGLDTIILTGYPGTMMSTWQQAGRAGRCGTDALAILVAAQNPLDQYFVHHPERFFSRPHEHAIIDTKNPYIIAGHLLCAASELPVTLENDKMYFGDHLSLVLEAHLSTKLIAQTAQGYVYAGRMRAGALVSLGSVSSSATYTVEVKGRVLETMDKRQAFREAYPGAILLHQGERYLVTSCNTRDNRILAEKTDVQYHTRVISASDISIIEEQKTQVGDGFTLHYGIVQVTEASTGYKKVLNENVIGTCMLDLPPISFTTRSVWVTISPDICSVMIENGYDPAGALHGAEHALIAMFPFHVLCDRWDLGGLSSLAYKETGNAIIFIYDGYSGGIGLCERGYELFSELAACTCEMVVACHCEVGCPSCIYSPKCGNDNEPLDKAGTIHLLTSLKMAP